MRTAEEKQDFIKYITEELSAATTEEINEALEDADWASTMADIVRKLVSIELDKRNGNEPEQLDLFN